MNTKEALELCRGVLGKYWIDDAGFGRCDLIAAKKALAATAPDKVSAEDAGPVALVTTIIQGRNAGKKVQMLRDLPNGTLLYAVIPPSQPEKMPSNEELEDLWEMHAGHPADFGADVLERWGGWMPGLLGQGGYLSAQPEKAEDAESTEAEWDARKAELALQYPGIAGDYKVFEVALVTETGCDPSDGEFLVHVSRLIHGWVSNDDLHHIHSAAWEQAKNLNLPEEGATSVIMYESGERDDVFWNKYFKIAAIASQKENGG